MALYNIDDVIIYRLTSKATWKNVQLPNSQRRKVTEKNPNSIWMKARKKEKIEEFRHGETNRDQIV